MSFRKQLIVGIGALIAVMCFCAAMAVATLRTASTNTAKVTAEMLEQVYATERLAVLAERLIVAGRGFLLTGDPRERRRLELVAEDLDEIATAILGHGAAAPAVQLVHVRLATQRYVRRVLAVADERAASTDLAVIERLYREQVGPARIALHSAIESALAIERQHLEELSEAAGQRVRVGGIVLVIGSGIGLAIGIALAVIVSRRLFGAFSQGQQVARKADESARARKELLDMVSHDLRSPLNAILLGVDILKLESPSARPLTTMDLAAQRMRRLVEDLLVASEAETTGLRLALEPTKVRELFHATFELFATTAARADVRLRIGEVPNALVTLDRDRVLQILSNLVSNALSFTPPGGEVVLAASERDGCVRFCVSDTGPGIPEHERARLFGSFQQGQHGQSEMRSRRGSVGLGLYIAKNLVSAHGGSIGIDSAPGQGSTFWFELPREASTTRAA